MSTVKLASDLLLDQQAQHLAAIEGNFRCIIDDYACKIAMAEERIAQETLIISAAKAATALAMSKYDSMPKNQASVGALRYDCNELYQTTITRRLT